MSRHTKQEPFCLTTDQSRDIQAAYNRVNRRHEDLLSGLGMLVYQVERPDRDYKELMRWEAEVRLREAAAREHTQAFQAQILALVEKDFCDRVDALTVTSEQQASLSAFSRKLDYPGLTWKGWRKVVPLTYEILAELEQIFFPKEP